MIKIVNIENWCLITQTYGLTVAGFAAAEQSYRTEAKSLNRDLLVRPRTKIRSRNANDAVGKLEELLTNSWVAGEHDVIVAPGYVGGSQHALLDITGHIHSEPNDLIRPVSTVQYFTQDIPIRLTNSP